MDLASSVAEDLADFVGRPALRAVENHSEEELQAEGRDDEGLFRTLYGFPQEIERKIIPALNVFGGFCAEHHILTGIGVNPETRQVATCKEQRGRR